MLVALGSRNYIILFLLEIRALLTPLGTPGLIWGGCGVMKENFALGFVVQSSHYFTRIENFGHAI